jgi:hypothetical protein
MGLISRIFRRRPVTTKYQVTEAYSSLREMVLTTSPEKLGIGGGGIWGVVMESGYEKAVATLVAIADGTVSLYLSNGGGFIGMGTQEGPSQAARALLQAAPNFTQFCHPTTTFALPEPARTRFFILRGREVLTAEAETDELGKNRESLSPFFHAAHKLISQIRLTDSKLNKEANP